MKKVNKTIVRDFGKIQSQVMADACKFIHDDFNVGVDLEIAGDFLRNNEDAVAVAEWEWTAEAHSRQKGSPSDMEPLMFNFWTEALRQHGVFLNCSSRSILEYFCETSTYDPPGFPDPLRVQRDLNASPSLTLLTLALAEVDAIVRKSHDQAGAEAAEEEESKDSSQLSKREARAFKTYELAATNLGDAGVADERAYKYLKELDIEDLGYKLPKFDTWRRYLTAARSELGESKYERRSGRSSRSVVSSDDI